MAAPTPWWPRLRFRTAGHPGIKTSHLPLKGAKRSPRNSIGFAIRKGDADFLNFLDNWITVTESEGWLAERHSYWFRTMDWES